MTLLGHSPEQNRVVRNPNYGWRALRLLSRRSPHFFQPTNQKFKSLADYLDSMVSKLAKELPVSLDRCCFFKKKQRTMDTKVPNIDLKFDLTLVEGHSL